MLVFLIEIVGAEGVGGGGSEAWIGERKFSMDGRREKLGGGGGGYAKMHNDRNGKRV